MAGMANDNYLHTLAAVTLGLQVNLGNQGTGGVYSPQISSLRLLDHCVGHSVGTEDGHRGQRHLLQVFHETGSTISQVANHMPVVDDFMQHVHWAAMELERAVHGLYGTHNSCTKSTGFSQYHLHHLSFDSK
jgi:hypothetical protein